MILLHSRHNIRFCCCCCCCCCCSGLLGTPKEEIERALTVRVVAARKDVVQVKTKLSKAVYARDALAKVDPDFLSNLQS